MIVKKHGYGKYWIVFHVSRGTLGHVFTFVFHVKHWMGFGWWGGERRI